MTSEPRNASRNGWKLPLTRQLSRRPSTFTSVTPEARATCRAGGGPTNVTSTRWLGSCCAMPFSLSRQPAARIV